jgi:phosphatidate cytidylyltransferase
MPPVVTLNDLLLPAFWAAPSTSQLSPATYWLMGVVLASLFIAWGVGRALRQQPESTISPALVKQFNRRIQAWLTMCAVLIAGIFLGPITTTLLFFLVSFWALREFITMTPTRRGDHRALFWSFFLFTPLQYLLVGFSGPHVEAVREWSWFLSWLPAWVIVPELYGLFTVMIPVYASLIIPARIAFSGDPKRFLERSAKIQAGLLICVYALSHAPALLYLDLRTNKTASGLWEGSLPGLLFYFVLITQLGDLFQFVSSKLLGRHVIAAQIHAGRTWEGLIGGTLCTAAAGALLYWVTPFQMWESALMATAIALMGFAGGMTMSAIKRDRGVRDYGTLVTGHAGVLDRIDSLCFAAPVFFHLTRYFFSTVG